MDLLKALLDAISPPDPKSFGINNLQGGGDIQPETPPQAAQRLYYQQLRNNVQKMLTSEVTGPPSDWQVSNALAQAQPSLVSEKPLTQKLIDAAKNTFDIQNENDMVGGVSNAVVPTALNKEKFLETVRKFVSEAPEWMKLEQKLAYGYMKARYPQQMSKYVNTVEKSPHTTKGSYFNPETKNIGLAGSLHPAADVTTLGHEMTHATRANRKYTSLDEFSKAYNYMGDITGYKANPEEIAARQGERTVTDAYRKFLELLGHEKPPKWVPDAKQLRAREAGGGVYEDKAKNLSPLKEPLVYNLLKKLGLDPEKILKYGDTTKFTQ